MPEDSVTVMLMPEDETETILEKVRMAGAKKVNLIVPPGTRALQTLGGFTTLRKACDITGIDVTVYSQDEKTRDMATVCRFEVVSLDQEVRPRPAAPPEEPPRIVVSTRPPAPGVAEAGAPVGERPEGIRERLGELSADDLALFDALEGMSADQDVELRAEAFARPPAAPEAVVPAAPEEEQPARPKRPPKEKKAKKPSPLRFILDPLASALGNVYIAVVGLFLRIAQRSMQKEKKAAPAALGPQERTADEIRALRQRKLRYSLWALVGVVACTILIVGLYALFQPVVTVSLTPREAENREMDLDVSVVITNSVDPKGGVSAVEGGGVAIQVQQVQVELQGQASLPTSGMAVIPEGSATGAVIFVNVTSYAVNIPVGTRVTVAGGGITFHTTQDVWVPASDFRGVDAYLGKAQVTIVADTPGSAGNVAAGAISVIEGDLSGVLTVENAEPTGGGSERSAYIVTADDQEALRRQLVTGLRSDAYAQLQSQLAGLQVLSGTLSVETVEETFSQVVGGEAENLTLIARVRASALAAAPGALDAAVRQAVEGKIPVQKGQALGEIRAGAFETLGPGPGINSWTYRTHVTVPILNSIDDQLKSEIAGKLRGKTSQQVELIAQEYSDRIASLVISPVLPQVPRWRRLQVVDVSASLK